MITKQQARAILRVVTFYEIAALDADRAGAEEDLDERAKLRQAKMEAWQRVVNVIGSVTEPEKS